MFDLTMFHALHQYVATVIDLKGNATLKGIVL